jgi:hypothetical protein
VTPAQRVAALEEEARRIKGRLDELAAQLDGRADAWLGISLRMPETVAEVTVDRALAEARQQALALATITKTLHSMERPEEKEKQESPEDELAAGRKAREEQRAAAAKLAEAGS